MRKNERESFVMRDWRPTELKLWWKQGPPSWRHEKGGESKYKLGKKFLARSCEK